MLPHPTPRHSPEHPETLGLEAETGSHRGLARSARGGRGCRLGETAERDHPPSSPPAWVKRQGGPPSDQGASGGWAGPLCTPTPPRAPGPCPAPPTRPCGLRPRGGRGRGSPPAPSAAPTVPCGRPRLICLGRRGASEPRPRVTPTASHGSRRGRCLCRQKPEPSLVSDSAQNPLGGRPRGLHSSCSQGTGTVLGPDARQSRWEGGAGREPTSRDADTRAGSGPRRPLSPLIPAPSAVPLPLRALHPHRGV